MIFERAARREFAHTASGISVALLAILASSKLIRLLKEAAGGLIGAEAIAVHGDPLPDEVVFDAAVLQRLAKAFEPWLR